MLRDFENYCWRDLLTPEMTKITPLIIGPGRSRDVQRSSLFTHPGVQRNEPRMVLAIAHLERSGTRCHRAGDPLSATRRTL
jgi:hypothetical protein